MPILGIKDIDKSPDLVDGWWDFGDQDVRIDQTISGQDKKLRTTGTVTLDGSLDSGAQLKASHVDMNGSVMGGGLCFMLIRPISTVQ
jgi:hypothetical protein